MDPGTAGIIGGLLPGEALRISCCFSPGREKAWNRILPMRVGSVDSGHGRWAPHMTLQFELPVLILLLAVVAIRMLLSSDITPDDEFTYAQQGNQLISGGSIDMSFGPTYSWIYAGAMWLVDDKVTAFFLARAFASVAFIFGLWLAMRLAGAGREVSLALTVVAAGLSVAYQWPGVMGPTSAAILIALVVVWRRPGVGSWGVATGLLWWAMGARPEFFAAAIFATVVLVIWLVMSFVRPPHRPTWIEGLAALFGIAMAAAVVMLHGLPLGGRLSMAFGQHYAWRNALPGEDPWYEYEAVLARDFDGRVDVIGCALANPAAMLGHVMENVRGLRSGAIQLLVSPPYFGATSRLVSLISTLVLGVFFLFAVAAFAQKARRRKERLETKTHSQRTAATDLRGASDSTDSRFLRWFQHRRLPALLLILLVFTLSAATVLVIFPRRHYLLLWFCAVVVLIAVGWRDVGSTWRKWLPAVTTSILVLINAGLVTVAGALALAGEEKSDGSMPATHNIARSLQVLSQQPVVMLGNGDSDLLTLFTPQFSRVDAPAEATDFCSALAASGASVTWVAPQDARGQEYAPTFADLPGFQAFMSDPEVCGWHRISADSPFAIAK